MKPAGYCNELEAAAVLRDVHEWGGYLLCEPLRRVGNRIECRMHVRSHTHYPPDALVERVRKHADDIATLLARMCV